MYYILTLSLPFLSLAFSSLLSSAPLSLSPYGREGVPPSAPPLYLFLSLFLHFFVSSFLFFLIPLQCLQCNNQYWPAIDLYFTVLLALKDYYGTVAVIMILTCTLHYFTFVACLQAILMALHLNPYYSKGMMII